MTADSVDGCAELEALLDHFNKRLFLFASLDSELNILELKRNHCFCCPSRPGEAQPKVTRKNFLIDCPLKPAENAPF
jgi:hypothetical protein